ncbi:hypothetical protein MJ1_0129 [Nanobdella aerobiophila]|uniref:Uncharacterized protein n=1 Tax=Nanobdella aerobiophila TaxID=2586965 RepID=A0A915SZK1_9ARCH|nr:hypothetical protein [Nanobdella aerobiophila]BBL45304.1 hypothetical protein MJ1_0129 [Nanobdella aerobiophila]
MINYLLYFFVLLGAIIATIILFLWLELGLSCSYFINKDLFKKYENLFLSSWEITGTTIVFLVVQFEAIAPNLLIPVAYSFYIFIFLILFFFIFRNINIGIFEGLTFKNKYNKSSLIIYTIATLFLGIIMITLVSAGITGIGIIGLSGNIINWNIYIIFNYFNLLLLISTILSSLGFLGYIFGIDSYKRYSIIGYILFIIDLALFTRSIYVYYLIIPLVLFILMLLVKVRIYIQRIIYVLSHYFTSIIVSIMIFPYLFKIINIQNIITQSNILLSAEFVVSIFIIVAIFSIYLFEIKSILD